MTDVFRSIGNPLFLTEIKNRELSSDDHWNLQLTSGQYFLLRAMALAAAALYQSLSEILLLSDTALAIKIPITSIVGLAALIFN